MAGAPVWTAETNARLLLLAAQGLPWGTIGGKLDRSDESVRWRYYNLLGQMPEHERAAEERLRERSRKPVSSAKSLAGPEVLACRARRATLSHRDITAAVFGDPLPGRSALDRLRSGEAR